MTSSPHKKRWNLFFLPRILSRREFLLFTGFIIIGIIGVLGVFKEINRAFSFEIPAHGGTLREGIVGNPRLMNPLLAQTDADRDAVALTYAGLLRRDGDGNLLPALADHYDVSPDGLEYTFVLKEDLRWSDGERITASDVAFTIRLAKNPLIQSPRRAQWEGIEAEEVNSRTVVFRLKKAYIPFLGNTTLGILPKHIWEDVPPSQFPLVDINTKPVGAGPYHLSSVSNDSKGSITSITLKANAHYALKKPYIDTVLLRFYSTKETLLKDLQNNAIDSAGAFSPQYARLINKEHSVVNDIGLQRVIAIFLNQSKVKALSNLKVRQALNQSIDRNRILQEVLDQHGTTINGPFPPNIVAPLFLSRATSTPPDIDRIKKNLTDALRASMPKPKKGTPAQSGELAINLVTASNTPELTKTAELVKDMWAQIGVTTNIETFPQDELEQSVIGPRRYDAFLYGEEVIGNDPDPFAFWHSSQRTHPGLNIALYANASVDGLLEKVRTEQNIEKRRRLYEQTYNEISKDIPAFFLYTPSYIYITPVELDGMNIHHINTGSDRFSDIHQWYLQTDYIWKFLAQ